MIPLYVWTAHLHPPHSDPHRCYVIWSCSVGFKWCNLSHSSAMLSWQFRGNNLQTYGHTGPYDKNNITEQRARVICVIKWRDTVHPKKYAHGFCFAVLCCGYTLTDFPISIRLTSLALWQSNDCPSASKATLMNMAKYFMWIHYERLRNHNKAKHNKTVCIFLGIYCTGPILGLRPA